MAHRNPVDEALAKLRPGQMLFQCPPEMKAGVPQHVTLRLSEDLKKDLTQGLGPGRLPSPEQVRISSLMKAVLTGESDTAFQIKLLSDETQLVGSGDLTQWDWSVTPLNAGQHQLILSVRAIVEVAGSPTQSRDIPAIAKTVVVDVNRLYSLSTFWGANWQWVVTVLVLPLVGWLAKRWWPEKKVV